MAQHARMQTLRFSLALALAGCAAAPDPAMTPAHAIAAAESAFAAHSVREGMRAAFMSHFAEDGVTVRDGWVVSNAYLAGQPNPPIVLDWRPVHVEAAASGDFGLSTGPWKITSVAKPEAPPTYGQFVSIWKREPGQPWRVAVDLGIAHPQPVLWEAPLRAVTRATPASSGPIENAENAFTREARERGLAAAYSQHAAADLRLYWPGAAPALDRAQALTREMPDARGWTWVTERSEVARSGDFGYTRGRYATAATPDKPLGYFMRVWRYEVAAWRVVLEVVNLAPPAK